MTVRTEGLIIIDLIREQIPERVRQGLNINLDADPYFLKCRVIFTKQNRDPYITNIDLSEPSPARLSDEAIGHLCTFFG